MSDQTRVDQILAAIRQLPGVSDVDAQATVLGDGTVEVSFRFKPPVPARKIDQWDPVLTATGGSL